MAVRWTSQHEYTARLFLTQRRKERMKERKTVRWILVEGVDGRMRVVLSSFEMRKKNPEKRCDSLCVRDGTEQGDYGAG